MSTAPVSSSTFHAALARTAAPPKTGGASLAAASLPAAGNGNIDFADLVLLHSLTSGASLVGKNVIYTQPGTAHAAKGKVNSVTVDNGKVFLLVGQNRVALGQVRAVTT